MLVNSSDIYEISKTIKNIQKKFMPDLDEETLHLGMFGYIADIHSNQIQNSIIMASEWGNEAFPIRAKFDRSILTNVSTYNIENINAKPSVINVMIGFIESDINKVMIDNKFVISRFFPFKIEDYEFHLDYDIIIQRSIRNREVLYSAVYNIDYNNKLSDIINPYLQSPIKLVVDNNKFIFINCTLRQIKYNTINTKIVSSDILENKTIDFEFDNQLADFEVVVTNNNTATRLVPIVEGLSKSGIDNYCFYSYLDRNSIRISFDSNGYVPKINSDVDIIMKTTLGSEGNFKYKDDIICIIKSPDSKFVNVNSLIRPISSATNGMDMKSIEQIKEMIPKEILSRGNIINNKDLENFFNEIDDTSKMYFFKKRDNQFERLYYGYILIKDNNENIVPTNTINMVVNKDDLLFNSDRYRINPFTPIVLNNNEGNIYKGNLEDIPSIENNSFVYSSPFTIVINKKPLSISYYLDNINRDYELKYVYINNDYTLQFISNYIHIHRNSMYSDNYTVSMNLTQSINVNYDLVEYDEYGNIINCKIYPTIVIHKNGNKYYKYGKIVSMNISNYTYNVVFDIETDVIDNNNEITLKDFIKQGTTSNIDIKAGCDVDVSFFIYIEGEDSDSSLNENNLIIPNSNKVLVNRYDTTTKVSLFHNFSNDITSKIKVLENGDFQLKEVPMIRHTYITNELRCEEFISNLIYRKTFIDNALNVLENSFSIDLKFFNTYGPSNIFKIGHNDEYIDKVNISLTFRIKMFVNTYDNIKTDICNFITQKIENINIISDIHMSNLITEITNEFKDYIEFVEFVNINKFDTSYQYIQKTPVNILERVPEFINIHLNKEYKPDINIINI